MLRDADKILNGIGSRNADLQLAMLRTLASLIKRCDQSAQPLTKDEVESSGLLKRGLKTSLKNSATTMRSPRVEKVITVSESIMMTLRVLT